jgi:hypothetical protein
VNTDVEINCLGLSDVGFEIERANGRASRSSARPFAGERSAAVIIHAITQPAQADFGVTLSLIYRETEKYLGRLGRAASEGRAVDEANNFLRWLQFSGVCRLLESYSFIDKKFLTLRKQADELQDICKPHLQGRNIKENPSQSRIDELNDKVDIILAAIAKKATVTVEPMKQIEVGGVA